MENLAKMMDDLGGTPFMETTKCLHFQEELEDGTANFWYFWSAFCSSLDFQVEIKSGKPYKAGEFQTCKDSQKGGPWHRNRNRLGPVGPVGSSWREASASKQHACSSIWCSCPTYTWDWKSHRLVLGMPLSLKPPASFEVVWLTLKMDPVEVILQTW